MRFSHKDGLPRVGVAYYSQVNAPILAYPYVREIVAHATGGLASGAVIIEPLDVPKYTEEATMKWASQFAETSETRTDKPEQGKDASTAQDESAV